jgi:hypothetical protein
MLSTRADRENSLGPQAGRGKGEIETNLCEPIGN